MHFQEYRCALKKFRCHSAIICAGTTRPSCSFVYTSVKIIKNEDVGMTRCQKLLKQEGTARSSRIESMQQSSATPKTKDVGRGLRKIVACSQSSSQCLLVSTVFGTVSSLHPTSIFTLVPLIFSAISMTNTQ